MKQGNKFARGVNIRRRLYNWNMSGVEEPRRLWDYYGQTSPYPGYTPTEYPGGTAPMPPMIPYPGMPMTPEKYNDLLDIIKAQMGKPYVGGAHPMPDNLNPTSFDCAGFVGYCYMRAGLLPTGWYTTMSLWQYLVDNGELISVSNAEPGDIVLTNDTKGGHNYPAAGNGTNSHALIYIGNNMCADCSSSRGGVGWTYTLTGGWIEPRLTGGGVWRLKDMT